MFEREERPIIPKFHDFLVPGASPPPSILEKNILEFCLGCDGLGEANTCFIVGSNDQARYAARQFCGWAIKDGVRGSMTTEGFIKPNENNS